MNELNLQPQYYTNFFTTYKRRETIEIKIGDTPLGGKNPIRIQSMTTIDTMDTKNSVEQSIRMIDAGCEYVRITAPSIKEAQNLQNIKDELRKKGYKTPLIADIHFTPNAAELAARIVEKVRINPGNYADKKRFDFLEYTDASYQLELERIREKFLPLVKICKEYGTAMRIGTNHGSLSDRILSRYGDTPLGMVISAIEFIKICENENYFNIVLSMKSSNPLVMIQAYRLLVEKLEEEKLKPYPLHLGVTEAGEAEDGRIKSSIGIGTLLQEGLGDTIRVSLTEEPEFEMPVARKIIDKIDKKLFVTDFIHKFKLNYDPFQYKRRESIEVENIGSQNVPRVIADFSYYTNVNVKDLKSIGHHYLSELDKWQMTDLGADFIYTGSNPIQFMLPNGLKEIVDYSVWKEFNSLKKQNIFPLIDIENCNEIIKLKNSDTISSFHQKLNFIKIQAFNQANLDFVKSIPNELKFVLFLSFSDEISLFSVKNFISMLISLDINNSIILNKKFNANNQEQFIIESSIDTGFNLVDGFGDGLMLSFDKIQSVNFENQKLFNDTAFGILQASRMRITKTEYISCPSCGRTLFDLQKTTAMIRKKTDHLKGIKIGIMGCIVNGPGEMADADYGYVGSGKDKITLYRGMNVVKKSIPTQNALDELIELIKEDGKWIENETNLVI